MDVSFPVEEAESLQDVPGTVLDEPHGVALLGSDTRCDSIKSLLNTATAAYSMHNQIRLRISFTGQVCILGNTMYSVANSLGPPS